MLVWPVGGRFLRRKGTYLLLQRGDPEGMFVQAGNQCELFSTVMKEGFAAALADLLDGLEAIRDKSGTDHEELFDACFGQALDLVIGVRAEPGVAS